MVLFPFPSSAYVLKDLLRNTPHTHPVCRSLSFCHHGTYDGGNRGENGRERGMENPTLLVYKHFAHT